MQLYLPFDGDIPLRYAIDESLIFRFRMAKTGWHQHMVVGGEGRYAIRQSRFKVRRRPQTGGRGYAKHSEGRFIILVRVSNLQLYPLVYKYNSGRKSGTDQTAGWKSVTWAAS